MFLYEYTNNLDKTRYNMYDYNVNTVQEYGVRVGKLTSVSVVFVPSAEE